SNVSANDRVFVSPTQGQAMGTAAQGTDWTAGTSEMFNSAGTVDNFNTFTQQTGNNSAVAVSTTPGVDPSQFSAFGYQSDGSFTDRAIFSTGVNNAGGPQNTVFQQSGMNGDMRYYNDTGGTGAVAFAGQIDGN